MYSCIKISNDTHHFLCVFPLSSCRNGLLPRHGQCNHPRDHVLLLRTLCCRTSLPEIPVVEEVHDGHPACMSFFLKKIKCMLDFYHGAGFNFLITICRFTDTVCPGVHPHQPVLLHGKVRLPGSPLDSPHLDVWRLLLLSLLQLLDTGLHKGQAATYHREQLKTERLNQCTHHRASKWETHGEWECAPPHQRQSPPRQSKRNLTW